MATTGTSCIDYIRPCLKPVGSGRTHGHRLPQVKAQRIGAVARAIVRLSEHAAQETQLPTEQLMTVAPDWR